MDRVMYGSDTSGSVDGDPLMDNIKEKVTKLFDESCILLTNAAGTDHYTADLDPELLSNLVDGMKFVFTVPNTNTSASDLEINESGTAFSILRWDGSALQPGDLGASQEVGLIYKTIAAVGKLKMLVPPPGAAGAKINRQPFTASGTWTKPAGYSADAQVIIEALGAGGGGGSVTGGGGGAWKRREMKLSDLASTVTVTIGAGGATNTSGSAGGNSTFGAHVTAYGGGGGHSTGTGGGGGGALGAGTGSGSGVGGGPNGGTSSTPDSGFGGGGGVTGGDGGVSAEGGGAGGGSAKNGGNSLRGGGGGGGNGGTGGTSAFAGAGGNSGSAGTAPAGGGGRQGAGARGEIIVTVIG